MHESIWVFPFFFFLLCLNPGVRSVPSLKKVDKYLQQAGFEFCGYGERGKGVRHLYLFKSVIREQGRWINRGGE